MANHLSDADTHKRVRWINYAVNNLISYDRDRNADDGWRSGADTLLCMAGDCKGYAVLKMKLLNAAGIPASPMAIVVVQGEWINMHHVVLAVKLDGKTWVLDNLNDEVALDTSIRGYQPLYAFNSEGSWLCGTAKTRHISETKPFARHVESNKLVLRQLQRDVENIGIAIRYHAPQIGHGVVEAKNVTETLRPSLYENIERPIVQPHAVNVFSAVPHLSGFLWAGIAGFGVTSLASLVFTPG